MNTKQLFTLLTIALLDLPAGHAQTLPATVGAQTSAPSILSPSAAEVAQLARSGVSNDVVLAFIRQSQSHYNLSATDIAVLKNAGVSSEAMTAMLNHDSALRAQPQSSPPMVATPNTPQTTVTQSDAVPATATSNPTSTPTTIVVPPAAPPPQVEIIPVAPGPDYLWTPGVWSWNGVGWIWLGGYWHYPTRPGHVWIGGYWAGHGRGRYWVGGRWR